MTQKWSARSPILLGFVTLLFLVGGFGVWSLATTITGAIIAPGLIEVEQNRQIVQHPDGGVVAEIAVTESQSVKAGDLLIRLDGSLLQSELAIVEGRFYEVLARTVRLEAERDDATALVFPADLLSIGASRPDVAAQIEGQRRLFVARLESAARQIEQLGKRRLQIMSQIEGVNAQSAAVSTQLALIRSELKDQKGLLEKGLSQASRVSALQREEAGLLGSVGELTASRAQSEGRITEFDLEILRLAAVRREEANTQLRETGPIVLEMAERRRALRERIDRLDIRAPVAGLVLGLQVTTPRSVLRAADPVLYLIPQDRPLVIIAQIAPIHVDEVFPGQPVELVFSAFSARVTPQLRGRVASISADALTDQRTQAQYFRAEILLDAGEIAKLEGQALLPGMPVDAFIQTNARTPMAYLLQPFTDYFSRAFRES